MTIDIPSPDTLNRVAKILMDVGKSDSYEAAMRTLESYCLRVVVAPAETRRPAAQAALIAIARTAVRAMPGGVYIEGDLDVPLNVGVLRGRLDQELRNLGAQLGTSPSACPVIGIGESRPSERNHPILRCVYGGWRGGVTPADEFRDVTSDNCAHPLAGALAGAFAVSEVFQYFVGENPRAARRAIGMSLWRPDRIEQWWEHDAEEPSSSVLPAGLWLIGLGHLGQAYLHLLSMLPYEGGFRPHLVLQDFDRLAPSNVSTSVLTTDAIVGEKKTRALAAWADERGFETTIIERPFGRNFKLEQGEPSIALCGVDNARARAALGDAGFAYVVNAGLGAGPEGFLMMRHHTFPGPKATAEIWGGATAASRAPRHMGAYDALRAQGLDECGITLLAERSVGAPFVGMVAGCLVIAEVLRALQRGPRTIIADGSLADFSYRQVTVAPGLDIGNPGFAMPRPLS